jgi:hypothetical protein
MEQTFGEALYIANEFPLFDLETAYQIMMNSTATSVWMKFDHPKFDDFLKIGATLVHMDSLECIAVLTPFNYINETKRKG